VIEAINEREREGSIVFIKLIIFSMKMNNQFGWLYDSDLKGRFCYYNVIPGRFIL